MKNIKTFKEFSQLNEKLDENLLLEYTSYRISNWEELIDGLKEIGAPVSLDKTAKTISVDGVSYRAPKNLNDIGSSMHYDDKISVALRKNEKLTKEWKTVNAQYSTILNNLRGIGSITGDSRSNTETINWGTTGPAQINSYFQNIEKQYNFLKDLLGNKRNQEVLRKYEVLRHLFDRGYLRMAGIK